MTSKDKGLVVLGVPSNQFMGQEPGTNEEIATFCSTTFGVDFPLTAKTDVKGDTAHPFYKWMLGELGEPADPAVEFPQAADRQGWQGAESVRSAHRAARSRNHRRHRCGAVGTPDMTTAYDFDFTAIDGSPLPLKKFEGQAMMVVNVASKCGFTPQYDGLQKIYRAIP